jgi:TPR repeat protein
MRTFRAKALVSVAFWAALAVAGAAAPASAQVSGVLPSLPAAPETAADAALAMANSLDGAGGGISSQDLVAALEDAALAGQPMALYQLGLMYETGEGVEKDPVKAFGYFSQIADEHADTAPKGVEADIVAQSFLKIGEYYRTGLPEAGIQKNEAYSNKLIMHAASYFGDADAQYRVGELYLDDAELGDNPLQSARWLNLAARKGHAGAQAKLGNMLFNGQGIDKDQIEGLMWLTVASRRAAGTVDAGWIGDLLTNAMSVATPEQRRNAVELADSLGTKFGGL